MVAPPGVGAKRARVGFFTWLIPMIDDLLKSLPALLMATYALTKRCSAAKRGALFCGLWLFASLALAQEPPTCGPGVVPSIAALQDPTRHLTASEVAELPLERFGTLHSPPFPLEFSSSAIWMRFTLRNASPVACQLWLSAGEPRLEDVQVYLRRDNGWNALRAGSDYSLDQWPVLARQPLFPVALEGREQLQVLIRVVSRSALMISPRVWSELELVQAAQHLYLADGLTLGVVALIVPFSLIVGGLMRSPLLLVNALAILAYILLCGVVNGYLIYWPRLLPLSREVVSVLSCFSYVLFMLYLRVLFQVHRLPLFWRVLLTLFTAMMGGLLLWGAFGDFVASRVLFGELRGFTYILVLALFGVALIRGLRPSWLAWLLALLFLIQGVSRHWFEVKNVSWQYGEDQLSLVSSLPGVLLLVCTLIMEYSRSRHRERRALADLDEQQKAAQERLESTVARRTEQLSESLRARSSLLARISHDLRSPLVGIIDYARLLRTEPAREYPLKIERNARRQLELIDELLEFSRSELQQLELVIAPGYFYGFVHEVEDEGRFLALRQDNRFLCHFAEDLPLLVRADFRRLRQVLINLLANAAKFTRGGQIDFTVRHLGIDGACARLAFAISDTGIGMEADEREQLLQPFRRGRNAGRYDGSGLGLSIVSQLLRQMGSELQIESGATRGSCFSFELALALASEEELELVLSGSHVEPVQGEGRTVLLVDDLQQNHEGLGDLLGGCGFEVLHAREGRQALVLLETQRVDLVITDQMMPGLGGWDVLQAVREQWPALPVLLYSAAPPLRPATIDPSYAFDGALLKPADTDVLLALIAALLPTSMPAMS